MGEKVHLTAIGLDLGSKPARPRRARKPTLAAVLKQADKAGKAVAGATLAADGSVSIAFGEPAPTEAPNPWLAEIDKVTKQ